MNTTTLKPLKLRRLTADNIETDENYSNIYYNNQIISIEKARKIIREGRGDKLVFEPTRCGFRHGQKIYEFSNGYGASYVNNELAITVHRNCSGNFQLYYPNDEPWNGDSVCYGVGEYYLLQDLLCKIIMYPNIPKDMKLCTKDEKTFIPINHILSPNGIDMLNTDIKYDKEEIQEIKDGKSKSWVYTIEELEDKLFERIQLLEKAKKEIYDTLQKQMDEIVYKKAQYANGYYPSYKENYEFIECCAYNELGTKVIYIRKKDFKHFPEYEIEDEHAVMKAICNAKNVTTIEVPPGKTIVDILFDNFSNNHREYNFSNNHREFISKRIHIQCERLDKERKYDELLELLKNTKYRVAILNHIQMTLCFNWNIVDGDSDGRGKIITRKDLKYYIEHPEKMFN